MLYHIRHPLLALERVASVTAGLLVLETQVELLDSTVPVMLFYPGTQRTPDGTNWWGPNPSAVEGMLRAVGFPHTAAVHGPTRVPGTDGGRMVFHAWR